MTYFIYIGRRRKEGRLDHRLHPQVPQAGRLRRTGEQQFIKNRGSVFRELALRKLKP
jgi:hypothetical protein